jgi:hypothetical protein
MILRPATEADLIAARNDAIAPGVEKECPEDINHLDCIEHEGKVLAVGGAKMLNSHSAWVWVGLTSHAREHMVILYRAIRDWLDGFNLELMMASVAVGFEEGERLAEHMDFMRQCRLPGYFGPKGDAWLYIRRRTGA